MKTKTTKEIKAELQQNEIIRLENRWKLATTEQELDQIEKQIFKIKKQRGWCKMAKIKLTFIDTPAHGYLKVMKQDLRDIGYPKR